MNTQLKKLYVTFLKIKNMGYIKTMRKGSTGVGYTFEKLLGKEEDNLPFPDYKGIEIKTVIYYYKRIIHLFNLAPDGDYLFATKIALEKLGHSGKKYQGNKILNATINAKEYSQYGQKWIKLNVNWEKEKIELLAHDMYGEKINLPVSWSFESIKNVLLIKLNKLAIVKAKKKIEDNCDYFLYNYIMFYELKGFEECIKLIEDGTISIRFSLNLYKEETKKGKIHDRGTNFFILEKDIEKLFNRIKS